jgi:asparaginyl-tRNA synthetase
VLGRATREMLLRSQARRLALLHAAAVRSVATKSASESVKDLRWEDAPADGRAGATVLGWVRSVRRQRHVTFIEVSDGSCLKGIQAVVTGEVPPQVATGASVRLQGRLVAHPKGRDAGFPNELHVPDDSQIDVLGLCDPETYPLQKKGHSFEFLRDHVHLRPRTNTIGAVTRVRHRLAATISSFFDNNAFFQVHTPVFTGSDCEGAGETFLALPNAHLSLLQAGGGHPEAHKGFFGAPAHLTVSGQLHAEAFACAMSRVYTFGPTFRAENSNTSRHLAEFWMLEPEIAFAGAAEAMDVAEGCVRACVESLLQSCGEDLEFFGKHIDQAVQARLESCVASQPYVRATYTDVIEELQRAEREGRAPHNKEGSTKVVWGDDLSSEQEKWACQTMGGGRPMLVTRYPASLKAFYMRQSEPEGREEQTVVEAFDMLVPRVGELVGGSAREERQDVLLRVMRERGMLLSDGSAGALQWYVDLRRFGTVPHAGFGLGFERLVQFVTGIENIREAIPVPRAPGLFPL